MSRPSPAPEPAAEAAIARTEQRRAMLAELADLAMGVARDLAEAVRADAQAEDGEGAQRSARLFAQAARAVRFCLALEAREEDRLLALRNGEAPRGAARRIGSASEPPTCTYDASLERVRTSVVVAANQKARSVGEAAAVLDPLHERLFDREDYGAFLALPFRECVAAICNDLGLEPDWSLWSDEAGFRSRGGALWHTAWRDDPRRPDRVARWRADRIGVKLE